MQIEALIRMFSPMTTAKYWEHFGGGLGYLLDKRRTRICDGFYQEYKKTRGKIAGASPLLINWS